MVWKNSAKYKVVHQMNIDLGKERALLPSDCVVDPVRDRVRARLTLQFVRGTAVARFNQIFVHFCARASVYY